MDTSSASSSARNWKAKDCVSQESKNTRKHDTASKNNSKELTGAFASIEGSPLMEYDQSYPMHSSGLLSSTIKSFDPCSENYIGTPYGTQPVGLDFVGMPDYLSYKNLDLNCDVTQSFDPNFEAPDFFMRPRRDSIDCLFEHDQAKADPKLSEDRKSIVSPTRLYPMPTFSKVFDEDLRYGNRRFFNDGMAPSTFTDGLGGDYEFNEKLYNPIMRQNSILTPTQIGETPQSTSPSTKKMSDSDSKDDETCSQQKRLCKREPSEQKGSQKMCRCDNDQSASIAEDLSVATKTASYKKQPVDSISEDEEEDMIYVPFDFVGDGRKREAKRHKSHTVVPRDEIDLDAQIREK